MFSHNNSLVDNNINNSSTKIVDFISKTFSATIIGATILSTGMFNVTAFSQSTDLKVDSKNVSEIIKIIDKVSEKDPQKPVSQKLEKNKNNKNLVESKSENLDVDFDLKNKKINIKNKTKGITTIGVPTSKDIDSVDIVNNKVVFSGKNAKFDVIAESLDGGVRQVINIKDSTAPDYYDFPVELSAGEKLVVNEDGSASVTKNFSKKEKKRIDEIAKNAPSDFKVPKNFTKLVIAKPWAKDANGIDLKTSYSIVSGNILRQKIELKGAVFPVVADPLWCGDQISSTSWFWNTSGNPPNQWTLSVYPSWCGFWAATDAWYNTYWDAWVGVCNASGTGGWCNNWTNDEYASMFYQFVCHYNIFGVVKAGIPGSTQGAWNIDEWRPNVGWQATKDALCNPS
jgi:Protein of unknown function (DUF2599)